MKLLGKNFLNQKMINPELDYLMWKLDERDTASGNDRNTASDADLRVITSLFLAEEEWQDHQQGGWQGKNYTVMIDRLVKGLETVGVTDDYYLAPYGGINDNGLWKAQEVWISYIDFEALRKLSLRYGNPWTRVYENMKQAVLEAQIPSGLYNSTLNPDRTTSSSLDNGNYSINSLWIMVRSAESKDPELSPSAKKALAVYKKSFAKNTRIVTSYTSDGEEASNDESPWAYALVARAAIELGDNEFAESMINKMITYQDLNPKSNNYGAILEGSETT